MSRPLPRWGTGLPSDVSPTRTLRSPSWGGFLGSIPDICDGLDQGDSPKEAVPDPPQQEEPLPWGDYFTDKRCINLPQRRGSFCVYSAGESGPVVFCLHALGYTGLSWALIAPYLRDRCRVVAVDLRGHGETVTADDKDMSSATRVADIAAVWEFLFGAEQPPTVLVGHAMGGAAAVKLAATGQIKSLAGLVAIDVIVWEGAEPVCLPHMMAVVEGRTGDFKTLADAMTYAERSGRTRNPEAARVSVPSMLSEVPDETQAGSTKWVWRTDTAGTRPFWTEWYEGLAGHFLGLRVPGLLLMSHEPRLTQDMVIAQVQGKYQLQNLPLAGYAIHEDDPRLIASKVQDFITHFHIGLPNKVVGAARLGSDERSVPLPVSPRDAAAAEP